MRLVLLLLGAAFRSYCSGPSATPTASAASRSLAVPPIVDDGDIVLASETDPTQIAIAPVPSPIGLGADQETGRLRN